MKLKLYFSFICFCVFSVTGHAEEVRYKISYVYDGDTVKLRPMESSNPLDDFKLRLTQIDAPEKSQNYGLKSRRALIKLCAGKNVLVLAETQGRDKYQRVLGKLQCNGVDAAYYQAENGYAWYYTPYANDINIYKAEKNARKLTLGLWAERNPIPPWVWRHEHSHQ